MNGATGWKARQLSATSSRRPAPCWRRRAPSAAGAPTTTAWEPLPAGTLSWTRTTTWYASGMNSSPPDAISALAAQKTRQALLRCDRDTTAAMTERIGRAGRAAAALGTELIVVNPADGPVSIEGYYDEAFSVPGLLAEISKGDATGVSAHVIACFDDTGLEAARCVSFAPVIGIGEAAFHLASMLGHRFTVVTTLSRSIAAIEHNLLKYGLAGRCARVRACELPVLSLH